MQLLAPCCFLPSYKRSHIMYVQPPHTKAAAAARAKGVLNISIEACFKNTGGVPLR